MNMDLPVVIMRANDNCFLDCLRACSAVNISVIPVIFTWKGAEKWNSEKSRFFKNEVVIPNPATDYDGALEALLQLGESLYRKYHQKLLIISSSDTNLVFLQENFEKLSRYFLQMGHGEFEENCIQELRKDTSAFLLNSNGVDIPKTIPVLKKIDINNAVDNITYPCVYKPILKDLVSSFQNTHNKKKAIECENGKVLSQALEKELNNGYELIVQEKVLFTSLEDEVSCYAYIDKNGNIRAISGQHKIIEHPHPYGTGVASVPFYDPEFYEIVKKIAGAYRWRGFLGIEFMRNKKTGKWVVIEINLRPWLSVNYQAMIGFNYIELLYKDCYNMLPPFSKTKIISNFSTIRLNLMLLFKRNLELYNDRKIALEKICEFINSNLGNIIFSYMIKGDEQPGLSEKEYLLKENPDYGKIIEEIYVLAEKNNTMLK